MSCSHRNGLIYSNVFYCSALKFQILMVCTWSVCAHILCFGGNEKLGWGFCCWVECCIVVSRSLHRWVELQGDQRAWLILLAWLQFTGHFLADLVLRGNKDLYIVTMYVKTSILVIKWGCFSWWSVVVNKMHRCYISYPSVYEILSLSMDLNDSWCFD